MSWKSMLKKAAAQQEFCRPAFTTEKIDWARVVTVDFETYFGVEYTLKKMSTSEYIRDDRFKAQMVGIKIGKGKTKVYGPKQIARALKAINWQTHSLLAHNCVPGDTEVLTRSGWKQIKDVPQTAEIMQWDPTTQALSWCVPLAKIKNKAKELVSWGSSFHRGQYTAGHRMYFQTPDKAEWQVDTAENVAKRSMNNTYIPLSGYYAGSTDGALTEAEARLMEAIRADGSWRITDGAFYGVQFNIRKDRKAARLRELCVAVGVDLSEPDARGRMHIHRTQAPVLAKLFELLGLNKTYGRWLIEQPLAIRQAVLEELIFWDGHETGKKGFQWGTASYITAATIETVAHVSGWRVSGTWRDNARGFNAKNPDASLFVATVTQTSRAKLVNKPTIKKHSGAVYCFTVPTGAFLMRAGGRICVTGNCAFDGLILSHHYGIIPARYYDTLSMARGLHSNEVGGSLDDVAKFYDGEGKIDGVLDKTKGVYDWPKALYDEAAVYCAQDVDETFRIFQAMHAKYPVDELDLIHMTIRMFCDPVLKVDIPRVEAEYAREVERREKLFFGVIDPTRYDIGGDLWEKELHKKLIKGPAERELEGIDRGMHIIKRLLGNNEFFVSLLAAEDIEAPKKISKAWMALSKDEQEERLDDKYSYAFAKDDSEFIGLPDNIDLWRGKLDPNKKKDIAAISAKQDRIKALVDARLAVKSTTNITRAERFLEAGKDGMPLPVGYSYYRAHCLTGDAQVLTRDGWVALAVWRGGEIAQWSQTTTIEFAHATANQFEVDESLVQADSRYHTCTYTKGHTLPTFTSYGTFKSRKAGEALDTRFDIPISGLLDGGADISVLQAQIAVMVQADGNVRGDVARGRCVRFGFTKQRKIDRCRALLREAGVAFSMAMEGDVCRIRVGAADFERMTFLLGENKEFSALLYDAPAETKQAFINELTHWDGDVEPQPNGFTYSTTSAYNANFVATMAHLTDRSAFISERERQDNWSTSYRVYVRKNTQTRSSPEHYTEVPFKGTVYCPTTMTGFFLVRQRGNIVVTGNTGRWGGNNKMNMQNLTRGGELRLSILAPTGYQMAVCDSGQIEARVNGWLWGQKDLMDAFRKADTWDKSKGVARGDDRDAYCQFGDAVYGREITTDDKMERFVGKVCVAGDQPVLTRRGLVPMCLISKEDWLWDGVEWVRHDGLIDQGIQEVITYDGLTATPDHEVFTEDGRVIPLRQAASEMVRLQSTGIEGQAVRFCDDHVIADTPRKRLSVRIGKVQSFGGDETNVLEQLEERQDNVVPQERSQTGRECGGTRPTVRRDSGQMQQPGEQAVAELRRTRDQMPVQDAHGVHPVGLEEFATRGLRRCGDRQNGQRRELRAGESEAGHPAGEHTKPTQHCEDHVVGQTLAFGRLPEPVQQDLDIQAGGVTGADRGTNLRKVRVYDIANAGPRLRYTVAGKLVFNCVLGLGFQMGAPKFQMTLAKGALGGPPVYFELSECHRIVNTYRNRNYKIRDGWGICTGIIEDMAEGREGSYKCLNWEKGVLWLPNGMSLKYPDLRKRIGDKGWDEWTYQSGDMRSKIYGGLLTENIVQALARIVVATQMLAIDRKYRVVMTTHDEAVALPKTREAQKCFDYMTLCFRTAPAWCLDLPLNSEGGWAANYSK